MFYKNKKNSGYIAIVTAVILSSIVYFLAFSFSETSTLGRYDALILNNKKESRYLAESCLDYGKLQLAQNINYTGSETVTLPNGTCFIGAVTTQGSNKIFTSTASFGNSKTVLRLTLTQVNLGKIKLEELQS